MTAVRDRWRAASYPVRVGVVVLAIFIALQMVKAVVTVDHESCDRMVRISDTQGRNNPDWVEARDACGRGL